MGHQRFGACAKRIIFHSPPLTFSDFQISPIAVDPANPSQTKYSNPSTSGVNRAVNLSPSHIPEPMNPPAISTPWSRACRPVLRQSFVPAALAVVGLFVSTAEVRAQISIPNSSPVTENFNAIGATGTAALPANWKMTAAGAGTSAGWATVANVTATTQAASSGAPTAGGRYNWGNGTTTT
ncbi:MAG: hypothetical protein CFE26_15600, partial [Verrucomicrobiales bacterium VVV1]